MPIVVSPMSAFYDGEEWMVNDIRIALSFLGHRKRRKLEKLIGPGATGWLLNLWISTAMNRPKGILFDMDEGDMAVDADYDGDPSLFVDALLKAGFLEKKNGVFELHDWKENQRWAYYSKERSASASMAAAEKWEKSRVNRQNRSMRLTEARKKGTHTKDQWESMKEFFGHSCLICGSTDRIEKDHITPIYQGGSDGIRNIQPLCRACNSRKGPENIDRRTLYCEKNCIEMPTEWLRNACETPAVTSPPSPSPSPSPLHTHSKTKRPSPTIPKGVVHKKIIILIDTWNLHNNGVIRTGPPTQSHIDRIKKNVSKDPNWIDDAIAAAPIAKNVDDSGWSTGKVSFAWFIRYETPGKILAGGYKSKVVTVHRQSINPEPEPAHPAPSNVARKAVKDALGKIGRIPK